MAPVVLWTLLAACGAAGLYLALAGRRRAPVRMAWLLLAGAGAVSLVLVVPRVAGGATRGWFILLSLVGVLGAVRMITHRRPVYSALYFILVVVAVSGLLVLVEAEFVAAALLIIYAGAILVTYVFVIMLAQPGPPASYDAQPHDALGGCAAGFVLLAVIGARILTGAEPGPASATVDVAGGGTIALGTRLFTDYVLALQVAGVLLLAAMVGAIAMARRRPERFTGEVD